MAQESGGAGHLLFSGGESALLSVFSRLCARLSEFPPVLGATALALYSLRRFADAERMFRDLLSVDPLRVSLMDVYSNLLYVRQRRRQLSLLAQRCCRLAKYRPETSCVCGNYFALYGMHEKAVVCFARALRLNPRFLSAWVLMGHEFVELRNVPAAIECYRRADASDFRALYALGQAYELRQMYAYAAHYFARVCRMRPFDSRMWCAMADCEQKMGNAEGAVKAYERAEECHGRGDGNGDETGGGVNDATVTEETATIQLRLAQLYYSRTAGNSGGDSGSGSGSGSGNELFARKSYAHYQQYVAHKRALGDMLAIDCDTLQRMAEMALERGRAAECRRYARMLQANSHASARENRGGGAYYAQVAERILRVAGEGEDGDGDGDEGNDDGGQEEEEEDDEEEDEADDQDMQLSSD